MSQKCAKKIQACSNGLEIEFTTHHTDTVNFLLLLQGFPGRWNAQEINYSYKMIKKLNVMNQTRLLSVNI